MSSKYETLIVDNLHKVSKGMIIKNYKELCNLFEMEVKKGKGKSLQLKQLERYFKRIFVINGIISGRKDVLMWN